MLNNEVFISVIIPVYNQELLVLRALDSVPKGEEIEIIVIDDGSTDNTNANVRDYIEKNPDRRIKLITNKTNIGVGLTKNKGLEVAKGTYIIELDSDDYFYPEEFIKCAKYLNGTDIVYFNLEINSGEIIKVNQQNRRRICGNVKFIRRDYIADTRYKDLRTAEDKEFMLELLVKPKRPTEVFTDLTVKHYNYPRENSLSDLRRKNLINPVRKEKMKYVIMCGGFYEQWETPKQFCEVNGERIVDRTIRLLKEKGAKEIYVSSNDPRFDSCDAVRLQHENSYRYVGKKLTGYWLDAFYPHFKDDDRVTFFFGDVYYTDEAIDKIINYKTDKNVLFGSKQAANTMGKEWGEPYAYLVNDYKTFMQGVAEVKKLQDAGKVKRVPIVWELYRYLNGFDVNVHKVSLDDTYVIIDDDTRDFDNPQNYQGFKEILSARDKITYSNVFYIRTINAVGGAETFLWQMVKKYGKYDITIFYKNGDPDQIKRLREYARVIKFTGQYFKCKKLFYNYYNEIARYADADEYIQIIHADYKALGITNPALNYKTTKYIGVSQHVTAMFTELTGADTELMYNPYVGENPDKALILISATRMGREKGRYRMEKLCKILDDAGIKFIWLVFTDAQRKINHPSVAFMPKNLDILPYIKAADYYVQLSDNEGYCYSAIEALSVGTPCIVTPCPVFKELGLNNKNSITVDFDMKDVPVEKIKKGLPKVKYTVIPDKWGDVLAHDPKNYDPEKENRPLMCQVVRPYTDVELKRNMKVGEKVEMQEERALTVKAAGYIEIIGG